MDERASTGIHGLDDLIEGGFPRGRTILVSGACGTGKSIFAMQFLYHGALEKQEPGVFVTFDEAPEHIRSDMMRFGWNLAELEKHNLLAIVDGASARAGTPSNEEHSLNPGELSIDRVLTDILTIARRNGAKRMVIDSIPAMAFQMDGEHQIRKGILRMDQILSKSGMTSIITTEIPEQSAGAGNLWFSKYGVEEYIADGVIMMNFLGFGSQASRTITIRKMRGTKHSLETHAMEITERGITVKKIDTL